MRELGFTVPPRAQEHERLLQLMVEECGLRASQMRTMLRVLADIEDADLNQAARLAGIAEEQLAEGWMRLMKRTHPGLNLEHLNFNDLYKVSVESRTAAVGLNKAPIGPLSVTYRGRDGKACAALLLAATKSKLTDPEVDLQLRAHTVVLVAAQRTVECVYYRHIEPPIDRFDAHLNEMYSSDLADMSSEGSSTAVEKAWVALLRHAAFAGASDVQLLGSTEIGAIKLRIDGAYRHLRFVPQSVYSRLLERLMLLTKVTGEELERSLLKEGRFDLEDANVVDLKGLQQLFAFRPQIGEGASGRTATIRILSRAGAVANFDALGFNKSDATFLRGLMDLSDGLIIFSGPTGSGKTNTLDALVQLIDPETRSVQTLENPVELVDPRRMQYELHSNETREEDLAKSVLKGMLRNDPDVIIVGEVRTAEMMELLVRASRTGHLVAATVHADDTGGTVHQFRQWQVSAEDIASQLRAVVALRLVRLLCTACKKPLTQQEVGDELSLGKYQPYKDIVEECEQQSNRNLRGSWFRENPLGCVECNYSGYRGRRLIYELLRGDATTKNAIRGNKSSVALTRSILSPMETLAGRALLLVMTGATSLEEVRVNVPVDAGHVLARRQAIGQQSKEKA